MEYSIQEIAKVAGTTSRTLRHYDEIGVVPPSRVGHNGYRYYDDRALVRLQRVLLLRDLGLGLDRIAEVLAAQDARASGRAERDAEAQILGTHRDLLRAERDRVDRQIAAVERTIAALTATEEGNGLMEANMFDGFDHTKHREEVTERWGAAAYAQSSRWWDDMSEDQRRQWQGSVADLNADWKAAAEAGFEPESDAAQALAARHIAWLRSVPGTPAGDAFAPYVRGLGEMYVSDERFAANYGGVAGAALVRDALAGYIDATAG